MSESNNNKTSASFGYKKVTEIEKTSLVDNVFTSVTERYDPVSYTHLRAHET